MKTKILNTYFSFLLLLGLPVGAMAEDNTPLYPTDIHALSNKELAISHKGRKSLDIYSETGKDLLRRIDLNKVPTGIEIVGNVAYVTSFDGVGELSKIDCVTGKILATVKTGSGPCSPIFHEGRKRLYVSNQFSTTIQEFDPNTLELLRTAPVLREPRATVFSKDGRYMFVANFLPAQRADLDYVASCVSVIDLKSMKNVKDILLANGSNALRDLCITPDGKYIYVSHNLGRFTVPTSQLQQGWMNTSAFSVIDVEEQAYLGAVVVDEPDLGAAGVWGIQCTDDAIYITHSGTHELSVIDHPKFLERFVQYPNKEQLDYDLRFLYGLRTRVKLNGNGPRNFVMQDDLLIVPTYFADELNFYNISDGNVSSLSLNPSRKESEIDKGEKYFNDAALCYQGWQSCNGCHPGDARTDAMNWDLMNDGVGNSKNCKSLLFSHISPPSMISGVRASAHVAVRKGFEFIQFHKIEEDKAVCVDAYLQSLEPVVSPYRIDGELSPLAKEGKKVFQDLDCARCHSGPLFTDQKMYRIGEDVEFEAGWDTPTLREVWRTAPYLFDGRAATMEDVFLIHNHGTEKKLSKKEVKALVEYVNSL